MKTSKKKAPAPASINVAGIYSVIAFGVAQRTREIGVRLALGAGTRQIFTLILREGLAIVGLGAPVGVLASLFMTRLIVVHLYGVGPHDPAAMAAAVLLIAAAAVMACWLPGRRASRVDPIEALRAD
jgi:putative ABC transport system permease protein